MVDLSHRPAEDTTDKQAGREEILVRRALDVAARFYPNRESEHCKALARAIYSVFVDVVQEARDQATIECRLSEAQQEKLVVWRQKQNAKVLAEQQEKNPDRKHAHFGAIGGSITLMTTATTLGTVLKAVFCQGTTWEAELDLTDYSDW